MIRQSITPCRTPNWSRVIGLRLTGFGVVEVRPGSIEPSLIEAGVIKLDWTNVASPTLMARKEVVGGAVGTAINNGRVYVAAGGGGLSVFK